MKDTVWGEGLLMCSSWWEKVKRGMWEKLSCSLDRLANWGRMGLGQSNYTPAYTLTHLHSCLPTHLITKVHLSLCGHI